MGVGREASPVGNAGSIDPGFVLPSDFSNALRKMPQCRIFLRGFLGMGGVHGKLNPLPKNKAGGIKAAPPPGIAI
jgi:hypothetical protein